MMNSMSPQRGNQNFNRLNTLNLRLTFAVYFFGVCERASCWFKRSLSVFKRLEVESVVRLSAQRFDRLITLNLRLTLQAWILSVFECVLCWFKRSLSVFKRLETALFESVLGFCAQRFDRLITLNLRLTVTVCLLLSGVVFQAVGVAEDIRVFSDLSGRQLEARILKYTETEVEVRRVSDGRRFTLVLDTLSSEDRVYLRNTYSNSLVKDVEEGDGLSPGAVITLDFPELGAMAKGKPAQCQLSVPKNYDPRRPVPLLVWFSGGAGSHTVGSAKGVVDFDTFLVLTLPYPNGRFPRLAVNAGDGEINTFWEFQKPMLERVIELVPNISETVRIAGGSSSGGHLVGSALDQRWRGFCDYFTGYVLHEGGHCPDMKYKGARSSHRILVVYGENSTAKEWQKYFMEQFDQARGRIDYIEVPGAGHGLNGAGKQRIRAWIEKTFEGELNKL